MDLETIQKKLEKFVKERDWEQFQNPKNLAACVSIEAAELLEHFQWGDFEQSIEHARKYKEEVGEEIADVAIYLLYLCKQIDIDFLAAIEDKMIKNAKKYPISTSKGKSKKHRDA